MGERRPALQTAGGARRAFAAGGAALRLPAPPFEHLRRLTDRTGLLEHAVGAAPRREHGYCTDDVARALVVVLREQPARGKLRRLERLYLAFLTRAALPDGRFHNRLSAEPQPRFLDDAGSDDSIGRAVWALGAAARRSTSRDARREALSLFRRAAGFDSPSPRANAAAVLGAVEVLALDPGARPAAELLERSVARLGPVSCSPAWPWPETRLAYENARIPEARIAAGVALGDRRLLADGLELLRWLVGTETCNGHFSFTPARGWAPGEPRPGFDQQPIEGGAMADACARAFDATGDARWADACERSAAWFLGANDCGIRLYDAATGGCHDGLGPAGPNRNEGAESTLALISALQQARRIRGVRKEHAGELVGERAGGG